ncbi:hypothetical protein [Bacillus sp. AFS017336]|nr:hypothetical protein [Bacillus sp. AFS017336]
MSEKENYSPTTSSYNKQKELQLRQKLSIMGYSATWIDNYIAKVHNKG